jgi:hypothetical protein
MMAQCIFQVYVMFVFQHLCSGPKKMHKLLALRYCELKAAILKDLSACRRIVVTTDCWSKKGLTGSYLAISASFFNPSSHQPVHVLLNLHTIEHPHTGIMLADKLKQSFKQCQIPLSKILAIVTDNGSNMVKAVRCIHQSGSESETDIQISGAENEEIKPIDSSQSSDDSGSDEEENELEESEESNASSRGHDDDEIILPENISAHRLPCLAHTLQLVLKSVDKMGSFKNVICKARQLVKMFKVSSVATEKLIKKTSVGKTY